MTRTHSKSTTPRRAVGYVRISKARETETSTTTQAKAIRAYCQAYGIQLVDIIIEKGQSAYKASRSSRPGMRKAMALIEGGAADTFVCWKLDRAARNTRDLLRFVDGLGEQGAAFVSTTEQFDTTTPMGRAMLTMVAALAELEAAVKSERSTEWHEGRRAQDTPMAPAAQAPRGYHKPNRNELAIHPVEGDLIRAAFQRVAGGASINSTVKWLGSEGVTMTNRGLARCLTSPTIAGLADVGGGSYVAGEWPALVDAEEWHRLRAIITDPERLVNRSAGARRHPLVGIAFCHCGGGMRAKGHPRGLRLTCTSGTCSSGIRYEETAALVDRAMLDALDDTTWSALRTQGRVSGPEASVVEERLATFALMAKADPALAQTDPFRMMVAEAEGQLRASKGELLTLPKVASVRAAWPTMSADQKRLVYLAMIESLTILPAKIGARGVDATRVALRLMP